MSDSVTQNPWQQLKRLTNARIALGRAGDSLPTEELLRFNLAHARARDAVQETLDVAGLIEQIEKLGFKAMPVHSAAAHRADTNSPSGKYS